MRLQDYWDALHSAELREAFAHRTGLTLHYLRNHMFRGDGRVTRTPSVKRICAIARATEGQVTREEVFLFFAERIGHEKRKVA